MDNNDLKELLIKCWMSHDAMWFYHCLQECGIEKTNKINKAAVKSMSIIEIKRIQKLFEIGNIETFQDLQKIMDIALQVFKADFMEFEHTFPAKNQVHCEMSKCWAYDGINRMGVIDDYQCAIFTRIEGWFEALGIEYNVNPELNGCLMHTNGKCDRTYTLNSKD